MVVRILLLVLVLGLPVLVWGAGQEPLPFDYTFKPSTEPDGFRGIKWKTDISQLNPLKTMDIVEILGDTAYYRKKQANLNMGLAKLEDIIYEFWKGKFAGVDIRAKGWDNFTKLKNYVFARYGVGKRSPVYARLDVQDFTWNGYVTKIYLQYNDYDRVGRLNIYSKEMQGKMKRHDDFIYKYDIQKWLKEERKKRAQ